MRRRRRTPLVSQYIENLSSAALEKYAPIIRQIVGRHHGVYALYRRKKLYYIGLATNLRGRLNGHLRDRHRGLWDRFSVYLTLDNTHLRELESLAIRIAQPKGNKQRGGFARAEGLTQALRRRLLAQQRAEWYDLIGKQGDGLAEFSRARSAATGAPQPVLARYVSRAMSLRADFKGKRYRARVRKNGSIRYAETVFDSPSQAAVAAIRRPINGWWFWKFERSPGDWVRLNELRRR